MKFLLSNSQRKELLVRGVELTLALPAPPWEVDPLTYARESLPAQFSELVTSAEEIDIVVRVPDRGETTHDSLLKDRIGSIVPENKIDNAEGLLISVVVIAVTLTPRGNRHKQKGIQWPLRLE